MFKLTHPLPKKCWVAVSGGIDSMTVLHWLLRSRKVTGIIYVNHNTKHGEEAQKFLSSNLPAVDIKFVHITGSPEKGQSKEAFWRDERYKILHAQNGPVVLAHHLDDCLEEYIMCTMVRGYESTIPYSNGNCIRPFRMWSKASIRKYAKRHDIPWIDDPSNSDISFKRNYIRHELVPRIERMNPGVRNIVRRLIERTNISSIL